MMLLNMFGMPNYLKKQLLVAVGVYIGQFFCGYLGGWPSFVIIQLQDPKQTPLPEALSETEASLVASLTFVSFVGPYIAAYLSNAKGRRPCLMLGAAFGLVGFLLKALAVNAAMIYIGRVVVAQSSGIIFIMNYVYIAEISSTKIRGILLVGTGVSNTLGMLFAFSIGPFVSYTVSAYVGVAIAVLYAVATYLIPETPIFYLLNGKENELKDTMIKLGRENDINDLLSTKLEEPIGLLQGFGEIFSVKINRKAMFIILTLLVMQQLSGAVVVQLFTTSIFKLVSSSLEPHVSTIIIGVTQLISSSITPIFVERSGRRILMLVTTAACCLSLMLLGTYFYLDHIKHPSTESIQWLPLVSLIGYVMFYNSGYGIIPGTFTGEIFESKVRGPGSVFCITVSWCVGFVVSSTYTMMVDTIGSYTTFWIYGVVCFLAFVFSIAFVPETKGKSLLEIQDMLRR